MRRFENRVLCRKRAVRVACATVALFVLLCWLWYHDDETHGRADRLERRIVELRAHEMQPCSNAVLARLGVDDEQRIWQLRNAGSLGCFCLPCDEASEKAEEKEKEKEKENDHVVKQNFRERRRRRGGRNTYRDDDDWRAASSNDDGRKSMLMMVGSQREQHVTLEETSATVLFWQGANVEALYGWGLGLASGVTIDVPNRLGSAVRKEACPWRCTMTHSRASLPQADAVLFDPCYYGTQEYSESAPEMPERFDWAQQWLYYTYEQPDYFTLQARDDYTRLFDGSVSYERNSSVPITFMCLWGGATDWQRKPAWPQSLPARLSSSSSEEEEEEEHHFAVFMASNCGGGDTDGGGASRRTAYVAELMRYIDVDSYGLCLHNRDLPDGAASGWTAPSFGDMMRAKNELFGRYRFALVFENTDRHRDYVTEKLANALLAGTLPVYWGAPNVDEWLPDASAVVRAADFESPRALAAHLRELAASPERYAAHHAWRRRPLPERFRRVLDDCVFAADCRICEHVVREKFARRADAQMRARLNALAPAAGSVGMARLTNEAHALSLNAVGASLADADQYAEVEHRDELALVDNFTLCAWVAASAPHGRIVDKATAGALDGYELDLVRVGRNVEQRVAGTTRLRFCFAQGCFAGTRALQLGQWHHVAVSFSSSGGGLCLYVDGQRDACHAVDRPCDANDYALRIGAASRPSKRWRQTALEGIYRGLVDDVTLWQRVIDDTDELARLMFRRVEAADDRLVAAYAFNEGSGRIAHDASMNGFHARLINAPTFVKSHAKPLNIVSNHLKAL
jgi:Glycosyltransferase family 10 (fucosyltransferase) C-term/Concanavalin A-like lectin/glucanases superfamily